MATKRDRCHANWESLSNASFIGFTATPLEVGDRSTPAIFGDYIDVYDVQRAVEDGATVRIFYEGSRCGISPRNLHQNLKRPEIVH